MRFTCGWREEAAARGRKDLRLQGWLGRCKLQWYVLSHSYADSYLLFAVCKTDAACANFPLRETPGLNFGVPGEIDIPIGNMTCYKGGETVFENHQICNVTNRKILDMLPDRPPEVTFSCDKQDSTCQFQFWTAQVESFYCTLGNCTSTIDIGLSSNQTKYACDNIQCKCVPGRFICGENGSIGMLSHCAKNLYLELCFSRHHGLLEKHDHGASVIQLQDGSRMQV